MGQANGRTKYIGARPPAPSNDRPPIVFLYRRATHGQNTHGLVLRRVRGLADTFTCAKQAGKEEEAVVAATPFAISSR